MKRVKLKKVIVLLLLALLVASSISSESYSFVDVEKVIDGDTVIINGGRVRLRNINSPETRGVSSKWLVPTVR